MLNRPCTFTYTFFVQKTNESPQEKMPENQAIHKIKCQIHIIVKKIIAGSAKILYLVS